MKREIIISRLLRVLLVPGLMLILAAPATAFARENIPVSIDIPVTYIVSGNDKTAGGDTFTLTPDDPAAPMPPESEGGKKSIKISGEGTYSFGEIYYDRPEIWWYTITRDVTEKKGVTKDDSVYRAKVIALNDGHGYVLVYREGSDEKQELVYKDRVAPDTGDSAEFVAYAVVLAAAACALAVLAAVRRSRS
ncbi:MAG: hypothetical protein IKA94_01510 [Mogibacterium sp.]|nr:hypothetical protein [Mogibacterium sp.]MBR2389454.1 hypothetical protein [Mogibacterium sp.]